LAGHFSSFDLLYTQRRINESAFQIVNTWVHSDDKYTFVDGFPMIKTDSILSLLESDWFVAFEDAVNVNAD
jgi:hypothetical protein